MGVRAPGAAVTALVLLLAGCSGEGQADRAPASPRPAGSAAYTCDPAWNCARQAAAFVGADVLYPPADATPSAQYTAQRGVITDGSNPKAQADSDLVAMSYTRDGLTVALLGRTGVASSTSPSAGPSRVVVRGVAGEVEVCPSTARVTWASDGWVWTLSAPDQQTALVEANALRSTADLSGPTGGATAR